MDYETLLLERTAEGITTITFNRPEKRNAMNPQLHRDMHDALTRLEGDDETRVVIITGAGESFCAGQDLKEYFHAFKDDPYQRTLNRRLSNDWRDRLLRMFPKPTIAMINGHCFGGAFTIVASCDFAIASEDAIFGLSEVNWGNLPGGLVSKVIAEMMTYREALYYALTGEQFSGRKAAEMSLINKAVPRNALGDEVMTLAQHMAAMDQAAVRGTKEAFKQVVDMSYEQAYHWLIAKGNELDWRHRAQGSGADGIEKFLNKEYRPGEGSFTRVKRDATD